MHKKTHKQKFLGAQSRNYLITPRGKRLRKVA